MDSRIAVIVAVLSVMLVVSELAPRAEAMPNSADILLGKKGKMNPGRNSLLFGRKRSGSSAGSANSLFSRMGATETKHMCTAIVSACLDRLGSDLSNSYDSSDEN